MALSEHQVCEAVVRWLKDAGFSDAAAIKVGRRGFDIECGANADHPGWIIEAKGATSSKSDTGKEFAGRNMFSSVAQAFHTAATLRVHPKRNGRSIGIAVPRHDVIDVHTRRLEDACEVLDITIFRVSDDLTVSTEKLPGPGPWDKLKP